MDIDPRNVYALVSYGLFKLETNSIGDAIALMTKATQGVNKRTGFYVYFNFAKIYNEIRDWLNRTYCLQEALNYESNQIMVKHSLGVTLGKMNEHVEAIKILMKLLNMDLIEQLVLLKVGLSPLGRRSYHCVICIRLDQ